MSVSDDRWTCSTCGRTVVVIASQADVRCCIEAARQRHTTGHQKAADVLGRLPLPDPAPRRRNTTTTHPEGHPQP